MVTIKMHWQITALILTAIASGRVNHIHSQSTSPPFFILDPSHYRHYFPEDASYQIAVQLAPWLDLPVDDDYTDALVAYYYRIRSYRRHIRKTGDDRYWIVTEFLPDVPWAGIDNTISAAAGHHILEGRWFWDAPQFVEDYVRFWYGTTEAQPHIATYTNWIYHAAWQYGLLWNPPHRASSLFHDTYPSAANVFSNRYIDRYLTNSTGNRGEGWNATGRVCWRQDDGYDAMEVSVSGGGCRPTIAAAMWGEATALVHVGKLLGRDTSVFQRWASFSQSIITQQHWNPSIDSFAVIPPPKPSCYAIRQLEKHFPSRPNACDLSRIRIPNQTVNVRELLAFTPWYFSGLLSSENATQTAMWAKQFQYLLESTGDDGFYTPWGLRSVQRSTPCYNYSWDHGDCWNGPSWPYETSRLLTAVANLLTEHSATTIETSGMTPQIFERLLLQYAKQHTQTRAVNDTAHPLHSGHVFENVHPDLGYWNNREQMYWRNDTNKDMGDDYNHSTFLDLILRHWLGIGASSASPVWLVVHPLIQAPYWAVDRVPYRSRILSMVYDPDNTHYNQGKGMSIFIDGQKVAHRQDVGRLTVFAEPPKSNR